MFEDAQQQTLVRDDVPPQGWQVRVVGIWNPDLYLAKDENVGERNMIYGYQTI